MTNLTSFARSLLMRKGTAQPAHLRPGEGLNPYGADMVAVPRNKVISLGRIAEPLKTHGPRAHALFRPIAASKNPDMIRGAKAARGASNGPIISRAAEANPAATLAPNLGGRDGRPVKFSLRLDPARHRRLKLLAAHRGLSAQSILTKALDRYFDHLAPALSATGCHCFDTALGPIVSSMSETA